MLEFPSATAGLQAALALLKENKSERRLLPQIRIGLHLGEVMVEENGDLLGHGINVAARLQALADPGSALVSETVHAQVRTATPFPFVSQGRVQLDKMSERIGVFSLSPDGAAAFGKISRRRVARGLFVAGAIAAPLAAFAAWRLATPGVAPAAPGVAVLPFANLTGRAEDVAFAAELHDDLLTRLGGITAIRVIARSSVLGYAGTTKRASQIARELGVNAVLEGSVQRDRDRVRVSVQLVDGATDSQTWSETYDRALTVDNIFDIQREMTEAIARALSTVLTAREMAAAFTGGTHNLAAYEAYARGNLLVRRADVAFEDAYVGAIAAFDQAIALDPNFASAYARKVYALSRSFVSFVPGQSADRPLRSAAIAALDRAASLAPNAVETHLAFAAYFYWGFLDYAQALSHLNLALAAAQNNAELWHVKALITRRAGRFGESVEAFDRTLVLDPLNVEAMTNLAVLLSRTGEFSRAEAAVARARAINPSMVQVRITAMQVKLMQGDVAGAWTEIRDLRSPAAADARVFVAICTRNPINIDLALRDWPTDARRPASFPELYEIWRALALRALGRFDEARHILMQVRTRLDASAQPYPDGWYSAVTPDEVPGLLGDLDGVRAAERDFLAHAPHDQLLRSNLYGQFAFSFLNVGDANRAAYYLGEAAKIDGPSFYLRISVNPIYDALRNHPGYLALKRRYEAWARTHG